MKSHLESYPCPLIINSFWNLGFLLGITILLQIITGIFLSLYYISDINSTYFSIFFLIRDYPPLSTSFMTLSPSSTGNLIFGLLISGQ